VQLSGMLFISFLSYRVYPLKILKVKLILFSILSLICPYLLSNVTLAWQLLLIQSGIVLFSLDTVPAVSIFFKHFPVFKRFTYSSLIYAFSRALMYVVTSFGLVYLTKYFSTYGVLLVIVPLNIAFYIGLNHFNYLEQEQATEHRAHKPSAYDSVVSMAG